MLRLVIKAILLCLISCPMFAQHHHHEEEPKEPVVRPRIFLDKSPRIVAYQLKRLNNTKLLLVERKTDDAKYAPVFEAILARAGMSAQHRLEALHGLVTVNNSNATTEVLAAVEGLSSDDRQQSRTANELTLLLLSQGDDELANSVEAFQQATKSKNSLARILGYAALVSTESWSEDVRKMGSQSVIDLMRSLAVVPHQTRRNQLRSTVMTVLHMDTDEVRKAAIRALSTITVDQAATFESLASYVANDTLRAAAVDTLLTVPDESRDPAIAERTVSQLVELAEDTPAAERTSDNFLNAMQLADQLFARLPVDKARSYRQRLSAVTVRVIKLHTIEEEMRYDEPYFVVEAGRPVQVVLVNEDLMPHNLVITTEGSLKEVADLGLAVGPNGGHDGKQYVPKSDKVLFATQMVPPGKSERLTFTAPTAPGEYPYVCTFPRHWMRMYGVMLVVDDLDAYLQNPVAPKDPLGSTRSFVQSWTVQDFKSELDANTLGASDMGQKLFTEATCAQCHQANGIGGNVGPPLNGVFAKWKNDASAVLQEILEPSHRIDEKYAVQLIVTDEGETLSGIIAEEDKDSVSLLINPESKEVTKVERSSIEEMVKTSTSMMPKGLLNQYSKQEVLDLLAYVASLKQE